MFYIDFTYYNTIQYQHGINQKQNHYKRKQTHVNCVQKEGLFVSIFYAPSICVWTTKLFLVAKQLYKRDPSVRPSVTFTGNIVQI